MKCEIYYAVACNKGKIRSINQDNFWYAGKYLEMANDGLETIESGKIDAEDCPAFAVFDGMGGEQYGEAAAYVAAKTFDSLNKNMKTADAKQFLVDSCRQMNDNITAYAKQKLADCVGTTAAIIMFGEKGVCACNMGDSKIYRYDNKNLTQISKDHVVDIFKNKKPPLSQFLGINESEFVIEPYIAQEKYIKDGRWLICSDGLTDMVSEDEIKDILAKNEDAKACVEILLESALANGGRDNVTIILCKANRLKRSIFDVFFKKN